MIAAVHRLPPVRRRVKLVLTRPSRPLSQSVSFIRIRTGARAISQARRTEPELAAWTMVANVLLNLDEAITKE